jgi:hypothetical protein
VRAERPTRPVSRAAAGLTLGLVFGLVLAGCSTADDDQPTEQATTEQAPAADESSDARESVEPSESPEAQDGPTESPTAEVSVPDEVEVTAQGADLEFGQTATVVFEPNRKRSTLLNLKVKSARKASRDDFESFMLDDRYKRKANYYYVNVVVENVGDGNVGGSPIPLWGVNGDNVLLPAVNFTTTFRPCASTPLPKKFKEGDSVKTCLVYLSPDKGSLEALSFRPDQAFDPIEWHGKVKPPKKDSRQNKGNRN